MLCWIKTHCLLLLTSQVLFLFLSLSVIYYAISLYTHIYRHIRVYVFLPWPKRAASHKLVPSHGEGRWGMLHSMTGPSEGRNSGSHWLNLGLHLRVITAPGQGTEFAESPFEDPSQPTLFCGSPLTPHKVCNQEHDSQIKISDAHLHLRFGVWK